MDQIQGSLKDLDNMLQYDDKSKGFSKISDERVSIPLIG